MIIGDVYIGAGETDGVRLLAKAAGKLKNVLATYNEAEDLINIGAYKSGSNKNIDYAIEKIDAVNDYLMQDVESKYDYEQELELLKELFAE